MFHCESGVIFSNDFYRFRLFDTLEVVICIALECQHSDFLNLVAINRWIAKYSCYVGAWQLAQLLSLNHMIDYLL